MQKNFRDRTLEWYLRIDPPEPPTQGSDISRALLITNTRRIIRFREDSAETRGWADAYLLARNTGFIFCPDDIASYVFLAAEKEIRSKYGIRIPDTMLAYAKQSESRLTEVKRKLEDAGYYDRAPSDIRPIPDRLTRANVKQELQTIVSGLAGYSGLIDEIESSRKVEVDEHRVVQWLRQFEDDTLIEGAIGVLKNIRVIGRPEINSAVKEFIESHSEFEGAVVCPLGSPGDSSSVCTYYVMDLAGSHGITKSETVPNALATDRPILFVDDFIGTGNQAISIIETWLGQEPLVDLGEQRTDRLSSEMASAFKNRRIGFAFAAGKRDGAAALAAKATKLSLNAEVFVKLDEHSLPKAFGADLFDSSQSEASFRDRCDKIGRELLADGDARHDETWVSKRSLGYGNDAFLIAFPYNTPSQTLTCLWRRGNIDGVPWEPLLPRRKKR